jgi:cytochrome c biogenesis protein CcmG, thiol:disulfide interchange protein DsbE
VPDDGESMTPTGDAVPLHESAESAIHPSSIGSDGPPRRRRRVRWILVGSVFGAVALLTALFGFGLRNDPSVIDSALIGRPAPGFDLPALSGGAKPPVRLDGFRGQVVVVNFWASWCTDCRIEHSALVAAWQRFRDQGVVLIGIPFEDRTANSLAFAAELHMDWPLAADPGSSTALAYGVYGVPETFVISPAGRVVYKRVGPVDYGLLTDRITALLRGNTR